MRNIWRCHFAVLLGLAAGSRPAPAQQRWAAVDPNSESSSPVVWGASEDEARQRAVEACKRVSKTCANGPASTQDLKEVFAVMCCTQPRVGCAASAAATLTADGAGCAGGDGFSGGNDGVETNCGAQRATAILTPPP